MIHGDGPAADPVDHRPPLILGGPSFRDVTEAVALPLERPLARGWWYFFLPALALLGISVGWLFYEGIGAWGLNNPVGWAFGITNFVFWVGIGHAGTAHHHLSALFLCRCQLLADRKPRRDRRGPSGRPR